MKNLGIMDRLMRVLLAEFCVLVAIFWVAEEWQIPLFLIAGVMLLQAGTASCGVYTLLGWNSCEKVKRKDRNLMAAFIAIALLLAVVGSIASFVMTKNIFLEDVGGLNDSYSLALQYSGQGQRDEAIDSFGNLNSTWRAFEEKYSKYRPMALKFNDNLTIEMNNVSAALASSKEDIYWGNLTLGHEELLTAGPDIQKMQKE
ncbi:Uncharacterised protein [uncultured archaeon]|nr:Uncharacterised protein [uncultured archaeon]